MNQSNFSQKPTLFLNPRSPFARRIRLALNRVNADFNEHDVGNVFEDQPELSKMNPLGMVPTYLSTEGEPFSDSANLLEYLNEKTGRIWPIEQFQRFRVRQVSTWCAGIMQSAVLYFQEAALHESPSPRWLAEHVQSIEDTLLHLSRMSDAVWIEDEALTQAGWDLAVALEYVDFRLAEMNWRERYSGFEELLALARKNTFFCETSPPQK